MIRLHNTATGKVEPLAQRDEGKVSIYVCGPTVYAPPHIGHGRQVMVYDFLRRYLLWRGLDVNFVSNITDIDDKIIERAAAEGRDPADIAVKCEKVWWSAVDALNVMRPDHAPHATDYVDDMVELIERLIEADKAYVTSDGVYLSVEQVDGYGLLAHQDLDNLLEGGGERTVVGSEKRHPADFALWKLAKEGEPHWPSPWGPGRPGWHTECVVMSLDLLGQGFDLHTGGLDLVFPHHENERAQAVALGADFAQHWMHHGFVEMDGEKMSKSLGNVTNLLDLIDTFDPRSYRLLLAQSHYRSPMEVTTQTMTQASAALERLDSFGRRSAAVAAQGVPDGEVLDRLVELMDNDLDTAGAVDLLFRQVREANTALDSGDETTAAITAATALEIASVLGLEISTAEADVPVEIAELASARDAARADKNWALADEIRDQLTAAGWSVEDTPDGTQVRPLN